MKRFGRGTPPRLPGWDYSRPAAYFVTFNVAKRERCLARVVEGEAILSAWGRLVDRSWRELPEQFAGVRLDAYVVMPDHVHAVVVLTGGGSVPGSTSGSINRAGTWSMMRDPRLVLGKVVRAWKAKSTYLIRRAGKPDFRWQRRYYERIIRDRRHLEAVRRYIHNNPTAWDTRHPPPPRPP